MKNKTVAGILAIFGGWIGLHRFYLGQVGLGILYCVFFWSGITALVGILDGIILLSSSDMAFNHKYNKEHLRRQQRQMQRQDRYVRRQDTRQYRPAERRIPVQPQQRRTYPTQARTTPARPARPVNTAKVNPFKQAGIRKFKEYDYDGALEDFKQALKIDNKDVSVHFNLACTYSLLEEVDLAFDHLNKAVSLGYKDFNKIDTHDALAYVRIQPKWDGFKENNYQLTGAKSTPKKDLLDDDMLLSQLKTLNSLKERGLITEQEFIIQKEKLMA